MTLQQEKKINYLFYFFNIFLKLNEKEKTFIFCTKANFARFFNIYTHALEMKKQNQKVKF